MLLVCPCAVPALLPSREIELNVGCHVRFATAVKVSSDVPGVKSLPAQCQSCIGA